MAAREWKKKKTDRPKYNLKKRSFTLSLVNSDTLESELEFLVPEDKPLFSQAQKGALEYTSTDGLHILKVDWSYDVPVDIQPFSDYSTRNERNDIRQVRYSLVEGCYLKHRDALKIENSFGCKSATRLKPDAGGYYRVNIQDQWFRLTHVIKYCTVGEHRVTDPQGNCFAFAEASHTPVELTDASHICGNTWCAEEDHIVFEPHDVNMSRNTGFESGRCQGHGRCGDCIIGALTQL